MTINDSIQEISKRIPEIKRFNPKYAEALKMSIEALESKVPQNPKHRNSPYLEFYECPICGSGLCDGLTYCPVCGQAIDWSSGDEDD